MIDRLTIRASAVETLKAYDTDAGESVYSPRDWPAQSGQYPLIVVRTPSEKKVASNPRYGPPEFNSAIVLTAVCLVESVSEEDAEDQLEQLSVQIERALLTNAEFLYANEIQQVSAVETAMKVTADGERHIGEAVVVFHLEVHQLFEPEIDAAGTEIAPKLLLVDTVITDAATEKTLAEVQFDLSGE